VGVYVCGCVGVRVYINAVVTCKYSGGACVWCVWVCASEDRYGYAGKWGGDERGDSAGGRVGLDRERGVLGAWDSKHHMKPLNRTKGE
jgi:hypothetical protein